MQGSLNNNIGEEKLLEVSGLLYRCGRKKNGEKELKYVSTGHAADNQGKWMSPLNCFNTLVEIRVEHTSGGRGQDLRSERLAYWFIHTYYRVRQPLLTPV